MGGANKQGRDKRYRLIKEIVRERDDYSCLNCGCENTDTEQPLHVHHLVPEAKIPDDVDAHLPVNLVTVCDSCHKEMEALKHPPRQIRELAVESQTDLILSDELREKLSDRMAEARADSLSMKRVTRPEAEEFLETEFSKLPDPYIDDQQRTSPEF